MNREWPFGRAKGWQEGTNEERLAPAPALPTLTFAPIRAIRGFN